MELRSGGQGWPKVAGAPGAPTSDPGLLRGSRPALPSWLCSSRKTPGAGNCVREREAAWESLLAEIAVMGLMQLPPAWGVKSWEGQAHLAASGPFVNWGLHFFAGQVAGGT